MSLPVPGDVIDGKYAIERLLGQGGMGAVFIARETRLDRRVAIKLLLPSIASNPEAVARFEREARAAAALQSDHVTRVLSVGHIASGAPYIAMELLDGEDLAGTLERRGPLPVAEVIGFMVQACDALAEAHALGIVHRDLKPANIFLSRRPNGTTMVKVLDFGISKTRVPATGSGSGDVGLTGTSALMGTPHYMSPEQIREARNVDGRADIWALGVTIYQLLTGVLPFDGEGLADICVLVLTGEPMPLRNRRPDVPYALEAALARCFRKDPRERFATTGELVHALQACLAPGPTALAPTHASGPPARMQSSNAPPPPMDRPRTVVVAATVDPVSNTNPKTWLEPRGPGAIGLVLGGLVLVLAVGTAAWRFTRTSTAPDLDAGVANAGQLGSAVSIIDAATTAPSSVIALPSARSSTPRLVPTAVPSSAPSAPRVLPVVVPTATTPTVTPTVTPTATPIPRPVPSVTPTAPAPSLNPNVLPMPVERR